MRSIRFFLIVALLSTVTLGNFVAAVQGYRASMKQVQQLLDMQLADTVELLRSLQGSGKVLTPPPSTRLAFQLWSGSGNMLVRSANSGESPMTAFEDGYVEANFRGHRWRVLSRFDAATDRWIMVAERIDIRIELADQIILKSLMPIVFSLPIIGAIVWLVVGNGLSLIRKLASELRNKRADDLSRLHTADPPVELAPVVTAINDLLQRLQGSVERERRFSADAAHELRTPLSAIKVHVHNLKREMPQQMQELQSLDSDLGRLGHLIEQIMLLYRTAPEHYHARMQPVALRRLAQSVVGELYDSIDARHQSIAVTGTGEWVRGDEPSLKILARNLVSNASKYSPEGASIEVSVRRHGAAVVFAVTDSGPGIPEAEISRIFDRFYRVGGDRHASDAEGCGLGLSIVKHIADLHSATIEVANNPAASGLTVSLEFAATAAPTEPARDGAA